MSRAEKIMKKYGGAFGRVKALVFNWCCLVFGFSMVILVQLFIRDVPSADFALLFAIMSIMALSAIILVGSIFLQTMKKAKQNGQVSPVKLLIDMLCVGVDTNLIICRPFTRLMMWVLNICTFGMLGMLGNIKSQKGNFAERYIREDDGEYFYLYNDCGDYAILAYESINATTVEVWPHSNGYVHDNAGHTYRAL